MSDEQGNRMDLATVAWTPLLSSIVGSSVWSLPDTARIVWITLLAMKNKNGYVDLSMVGLARMANVSLSACKEAVELLESPDPESRDSGHEGRRIKPVSGSGWLILNFAKYRAMAGSARRREYLRVKKQEARTKAKELAKQKGVEVP